MQGQGIYAIVCEVSDRVYVGCTGQRFFRRWREHLWALGWGRHHNRDLRADWLRYGPGCFRFQVLERLTDRSFYLVGGDCYWRERRWIRRMGEQRGGLYNRAP